VTVDTRQFLYSRNGEPLPEIGSLSTETFLYSRNNEPYQGIFPSPNVFLAQSLVILQATKRAANY
jgi:hypothetical protein